MAKQPELTERRAEVARNAKAFFDAAVESQNKGDLKAAITGYNKTLALAPGYVSALNNLGVALRKERKLDAAIACYRRALERDPKNTQTLSNFGNALKDAGQHKESIEMFRRAMELNPTDAGMVYNFGITLKDAGLIDEALDVLDQARKLNPDLPDIRWDIALGHLVKGDLEKGWPAYESRWELAYTPNLRFPDKQWNGKKVKGTIVIATEQGYGDAIQFARYAPLVRKKCSRLVLECREGIEELLGTVDGIDEVVTRGKKLPEFDAYIPLLSLPHVLKTKITTIPKTFPYLHVDPAKKARCHELLRPLGNRFKVGIVWAGSPSHKNDHNRSVSFNNFLELLRVSGIALLSLQKGERVVDLTESGCGALVSNLDPAIKDFTDTAAFVSELDLVIMCDSSVAHLAGALGKPVWTLIPYAPDWRWLTSREDTPWYPSMRLFRQSEPGRWDDVFENLIAALKKTVAEHAAQA